MYGKLHLPLSIFFSATPASYNSRIRKTTVRGLPLHWLGSTLPFCFPSGEGVKRPKRFKVDLSETSNDLRTEIYIQGS